MSVADGVSVAAGGTTAGTDGVAVAGVLGAGLVGKFKASSPGTAPPRPSGDPSPPEAPLPPIELADVSAWMSKPFSL